MTLEFIKNRLSKEFVFGKDTLDFWVGKVIKFPHNEWFAPTNNEKGDYNDYKVCDDLHYLHLCEKKISPVWKNGSFVGNNVEFKINIS